MIRCVVLFLVGVFFFVGVVFLAGAFFFGGVFLALAGAFVGVSVEIVCGMRGAVGIETAIVLCRPENPLHVVLRLRERDVVDELVLVESGALCLPPDHAAVPRVVAGERVVGAAELRDQLREIQRPEADVDLADSSVTPS